MKKPIVIMAAVAATFTVKAQTLEEGIKMYNYERYESAKKQLAPLAGSNPIAYYYIGLAELKQGHVDAAAGIFAKYPDNYANQAGAAMVAFAQGKSAEGTQLAQALAAKAKKKEWEQLKYAAEAITNSAGSNKQLAVDWYREAMSRSGKQTPEMMIALGDAYQEIPSGGGQAQSSYEKASELDIKNSLAFSRQGKLWYDARNYELALDKWKRASEVDPTNPLPYRDMSRAYAASGKYDLALENLEKYYELSDKTNEDKLYYMDLLFLSRNYDRAGAMAQELINAGVTDPRVYGLLGFAQFEQKKYEDALKNAQQYFQKQDPKKIMPSDYIMYGRIFLQNNQADSAESYFNTALSKDAGSGKLALYREIGDGFKQAKNYKKSAQWYQRAAEDAAATATDYFWTGAMHYYDNNMLDAGKWFEQMETKFPDQPSGTYWRGRVAAAIDNEAKTGTATPFYTKWLEKVGPGHSNKQDLMQAYQYLYLYAYNTNDRVNEKKYEDLIVAIEPDNELVKQIRDARKAQGAAKPANKAAGKAGN